MKNNEFLKLDYYHRRERILDVAADLFALKGYDAVTTLELAGAAGCSESILLKVFHTKEQIYDALFEEWQFQVQKNAVIKIIDNSAMETLRRLFNDQISKKFTRSQAMRPHLESALYSRLTGKSRKRMFDVLKAVPDFVTGTIQPVIDYGQKHGEIRDGDPSVLANILWRIIWGEKQQANYLKRPLMTFEMIKYIFQK